MATLALAAAARKALGRLHVRREEAREREIGGREIDRRAELAMWKISRS
ncbi:MAG TPA: hypothetical protein VF166_11530 [Gemmatimonadaceae bacterium]